MGISGLLPVLKSITETKSIDEYRGKTLAIDGYCWLHRAIYSCSEEICLGRPTDKYIGYFMERITALQQNQVTPYVVFDGGPLPMKKGTEEERRKSRQKNKELGVQHYNNRNFAEARKCFVRAADVSPFMAHRVIQALKARGVKYVVAPYEADAQLAFLVKQGVVDGVITEDSDCLPFGCRTVLFKMDRDGVAQEICTDNLKKNKGLIFHMFTEAMFLDMCILSGCDYLPSIPGLGLKKAYAAIKQHGTFAKVIRALRLEGKVRIPPTYEEEFKRARLTFLHQRVYDPSSQRLVPLTPTPADVEAIDTDFLGPMLSDDIATAIAVGDMDPITMEVFATSSIQDSASTLGATPAAPAIPASHQTQLLDPRMFNQFASSSGDKPKARQSPPGKRKFPVSFSSRATAERVRNQPSSTSARPADSKSSSTSPCISRFFAAVPKKMSPATELEKKSSSISLDSMESYESQEPSEIDVSKNISFEPDDKKTATPKLSKENRPPVSLRSFPTAKVPAKPLVKENAFARMMRAGAQGKTVGGVKRNPIPMMSDRRVLTKKLRTLEYKAPAPQQYPGESEVEDPVELSVKLSEPESEAEPLDKNEDVGKPSDEDVADPLPKEPVTCTKVSSAKGNFFDRFRYKA